MNVHYCIRCGWVYERDRDFLLTQCPSCGNGVLASAHSDDEWALYGHLKSLGLEPPDWLREITVVAKGRLGGRRRAENSK